MNDNDSGQTMHGGTGGAPLTIKWTKPTFMMGPTHWFEDKAFQMYGAGPRPRGIRQWARCFWNADIFYGPVPAVKSIAVISWLIAWLS